MEKKLFRAFVVIARGWQWDGERDGVDGWGQDKAIGLKIWGNNMILFLHSFVLIDNTFLQWPLHPPTDFPLEKQLAYNVSHPKRFNYMGLSITSKDSMHITTM